MPGCAEQTPHTDYEPSAELLQLRDDRVPLSIVVAVEDGGKLLAWPGAFGQEYHRRQNFVARKDITLNAGDAVVFRGDLVHAGAAYDCENIRLHVYCDSPGHVDAPRNRTWPVHGILKT